MVTPPEKINNILPSIFLAGPIQGAEDWQKEAAETIEKVAPDINIANPRRPKKIDLSYRDQVEWESFYLERSAALGSVFLENDILD